MSASKWKPYPKYSDKGVDWLGEVPEHWDISTPRLMFEEIKDKNTDSARTNFLSLVSKKGIIPYEEKGSMGNKMSVNIDHYTLVNKGDFVLNSMNFGIGGFGVSAYSGITSPAYIVLRPKVEESLNRYLAQIFEDEGFQKGTAILGDGILDLRRAIGWKHLKRQPIPVPPHTERIAIAKFLETGTKAIDTLIPKLENMLTKIERKRSILITQSVTQGLKNSESNGWVKCKLKYIVDFQTGFPFSSDKYSDEKGVKLLRGDNISPGQIRWENAKLWPLSEMNSTIQKYQLNEGDIVIAMDRTWIKSGLKIAQVGNSDCPGLLVQRVARIRTKDVANSEFLFYRFLANDIEEHIKMIQESTTVPHISESEIGDISICLPPLNEQYEISAWLNEKLTIIDDAMLKVRLHIETLKEYRTVIISNAVTGKIDVRSL